MYTVPRETAWHEMSINDHLMLTILELQSDSTSILNIVDVLTISTNHKAHKTFGHLNLQ